MASEDKIRQNIEAFIDENGGVYSDWYVGIAADPRQRLFGDHQVGEDTDVWIWHECESSEIARNIEMYFLILGADGGPGGGDDSTKYIYAFRKSWHTRR